MGMGPIGKVSQGSQQRVNRSQGRGLCPDKGTGVGLRAFSSLLRTPASIKERPNTGPGVDARRLAPQAPRKKEREGERKR